MAERVGNPWDISSSNGFMTISGDTAQSLDRLYSSRDYTEGFRSTVDKISSSIRESNSYRFSLGASRKLENGRGANTIRRHRTLGELQHANRASQSYLMANPVIRRLYNNGSLAGYEDGFSKDDVWRGTAIKHSDANYRAIMSGYVDKEENMIHNYAMSRDEESRLSFSERIDTIASWESQLKHIRDYDDVDVMDEACPDISSQFNSLMG